MNSQLTVESAYWEFFVPQAIRGTALMLCFVPINTLTLGLLPVEEVKNASGLYNLMRNLGGALGLAVSNTLITFYDKTHYAALRQSITASNYQVQTMLYGLTEKMAQNGVAQPQLAALKAITGIAKREAMVMTFNNMFQIIALIFVSSVLIAPFLRKVEKQEGVILE
jgi:DHA2 family multidrug resistance protein